METTLLTSPVVAQGTGLPFRSAAVLGAGVMGAQIAAHLANAGLVVHLLDVTPASIGKPGKPNDLVEGAFKKALKLNPAPLMSAAAERRIQLGNFDEHFDRVGQVDWVIEVVVERLDVKQQVMARVEATARPDAVITTNTSGLPIYQIAEGRSDAFKRRFLGTHFFNPPRYLKLFEMIPTADTDPAVVARVAEFARIHLGKGVVIAKDTPNFIGNRIGVYAMMRAMAEFTEGRYTIEEIDALTGELVGHPKSATFRTADVVGLDTLKHVAVNLYDNVPDDESRDAFRVPALLDALIIKGALGQKTGAGFYKKVGKEIHSVDPAVGDFAPAKPLDLGDVKAFGKERDLGKRLNVLYAVEGRAGDFFRRTTLDLIAYAARRLPEIADVPQDVDRAIMWGFGWEMGPFAMWDALGIARTREAMRPLGLPAWADAVPETGFYADLEGVPHVWHPGEGRYVASPLRADEFGLTFIKRDATKTLWKNSEAALLDLGDGVALFEFRSKANALGQEVMKGLRDALARVENDANLRGVVIGNEGKNFSVGANLGEMAMAVAMGQLDMVEGYIKDFQDTVQAVRYARKPAVVATHQRVLGGGCEVTMASVQPVCAAETYIGLVELGVGLIPAGTGTMRMTAWAAERAANREYPSDVQAFVRKAFEKIAMAEVATSAPMAVEWGLLPPNTRIVMHEARRFHVAKEEVLRLSNQGYLPPAPYTRIPVVGAPGRAQFEVALHQFQAGGFISAYDRFLAQKLAYVMTGGALTGPAEVHEDYLIDLEREVFMSLLGEPKTQERVMYILENNKPLRN